MSKLVSIIIPVYNVAEYLDACLNSILQQTYSEIEVLLINDGSTDESRIICKQWTERDVRIVAFDQPNKGVSVARNLGLEHASGYYVTFVDADDTLVPDAIETLVRDIETENAELVIAEYISSASIKRDGKFAKELTTMNHDQAVNRLLAIHGMNGSVWAKLFLMQVIRDNNISFDPNIRYCEDVLFVYRYIRACMGIAYDPREVYNYTVREGSAMSQPVLSVDDKRLDIPKVFKIIADDAAEEDMPYLHIAVSRYVFQTCYVLPSLTKFSEGKPIIKDIRHAIRRYLLRFLIDDTYSTKTKVSSFLKYLFPKAMFMLKGDIKRN